MAKQTSTGVSVSASSGQPADFDQSGYEALTFTPIGEVISLGEFGGQSDEVTSQPLATGITEYFKGFVNFGQPSLGLDKDATDAGQSLLAAHNDGANQFDALSVKIELQDGTIFYIDTKVFSYTTNVGAANQMVGSTANLRINKTPLEVAPTP